MSDLNKHKDLIRQEIIDLANDGPINKETWNTLCLNTYERNYLLEFLTDEALLKLCKSTNNNVTTKFESTYESLIIHKLFPILCTRLQDKQ